jgi:hypothetical protein
MVERKSCGTCRLWLRDENPPSCGWPEPKLPFWAILSDGDHRIYTESDQGRDCQTWAPIPAPPSRPARRRGHDLNFPDRGIGRLAVQGLTGDDT